MAAGGRGRGLLRRRLKVIFPALLILCSANFILFHISTGSARVGAGGEEGETTAETTSGWEYKDRKRQRAPLQAAANAKFEGTQQRDREDSPLLPSLLDNPWVDRSSSEDVAALEYDAGEYADTGCRFRNFANASFYGRSEFVDEYVEYKRCVGNGAPFDAWAAGKITAGVGPRGELVVGTTGLEFNESATKCKDARPPLFVFAVTSAAGNLRRRKAIRRTWGKGVARGGNSMLLFFVAGEDGEAVEEEAARYGDVVRCKGLMADDVAAAELEARMVTAVLAWTYRYCERTRFLALSTDTTFVNEKRFELLATQERFAANRIYGAMLRKMQPFRPSADGGGGGQAGAGGEKGHHAVPVEDYPWKFYPPFVRGPSYVMSGDVIPRLLTAIRFAPALPSLPQVFFTGLLPLVSKVMRIGVTGFFAPEVPALSNECSYAKYGAIENVDSAAMMERIWLSVEATQTLRNKTCTVKPPCLARVNGQCMYYSKNKEDRR